MDSETDNDIRRSRRVLLMQSVLVLLFWAELGGGRSVC